MCLGDHTLGLQTGARGMNETPKKIGTQLWASPRNGAHPHAPTNGGWNLNLVPGLGEGGSLNTG